MNIIFLPLPGGPCWADCCKFMRVGWHPWRNHAYQILSRSHWGLRSYGVQNRGFPIHFQTALATVFRPTVLHCDVAQCRPKGDYEAQESTGLLAGVMHQSLPRTGSAAGLLEGPTFLLGGPGPPRPPVIRALLLTLRSLRTTFGDRAFPVAVARTWNSLPQHVTSASFMSVFRGRLKAFLIRRSFPWTHYHNFCTACAVTVIVFGHLSRSFSLLTS